MFIEVLGIDEESADTYVFEIDAKKKIRTQVIVKLHQKLADDRFDLIFKDFTGDFSDIKQVKTFLPLYLRKKVTKKHGLVKLKEFIRPTIYDVKLMYEKIIYRKTYDCPGCRYELLDPIDTYRPYCTQIIFKEDIFDKEDHEKDCKGLSSKFKGLISEFKSRSEIYKHTFTGDQQSCGFIDLF